MEHWYCTYENGMRVVYNGLPIETDDERDLRLLKRHAGQVAQATGRVVTVRRPNGEPLADFRPVSQS